MVKNSRIQLSNLFPLKCFSIVQKTIGVKADYFGKQQRLSIFENKQIFTRPSLDEYSTLRIRESLSSKVFDGAYPEYMTHNPQPDLLWSPSQHAQDHIWQVSLLRTPASRLDLTVPSSSIKSEALRGVCEP